ncbi:MAG TPA: serine/threonine-protein kinase [Polyangiaceae bacterium]|nr:serine/threonine-protein kinase [Polyangiaceae bacterium]
MRAALASGLILAGRYQIVSALGGTEFGAVYTVSDRVSGRECALKLFHPDLRQTPSAFAAYQEVERTVAALPVDAIARASDFGTDGALGQYFVVSELVGFASIAKLVQQHGRLNLAVYCEALGVLATSLDAAAVKGIVHGDLKPENLFFALEHPGWARISDFGTAALRAALSPRASAAPLGWVSPERMQGSPPSRADDVFALGLVSFYALTGRHYCRSMAEPTVDPALVLRELASERPSAAAHARSLGVELSDALDPWFARALAHDPSARFASASDAAKALSELQRRDGSGLTPGIAAAVAAPLLFQELPQRLTPEKPTTSRAFVPSEPRESGELPRSSRPPGVAAPRPKPREHVDGLPNAPPVALIAGAASLVLVLAAFGLYGTWRLFARTKPAPAALAAASASAAQVVSAPPPAPAPSAEAVIARPAAHFACTPDECEWIVCDGENVKKGVTTLELPVGKHRCSASRYGFRAAVVEFTLEEGKTTNVVFELLPTKAKHARPKPKAPKGAAAKSAVPGKPKP